MDNLKTRAYKPGDENFITPNEFASDWEEKRQDYLKQFEMGQTYTIEDDNGKIQAIANCYRFNKSKKLIYGWFLKNKDANPLFIVEVKKIVKKYLQNDFILYTLSIDGKMQDKMHKYLGFKKVRKTGGGWLWVAHHHGIR